MSPNPSQFVHEIGSFSMITCITITIDQTTTNKSFTCLDHCQHDIEANCVITRNLLSDNLYPLCKSLLFVTFKAEWLGSLYPFACNNNRVNDIGFTRSTYPLILKVVQIIGTMYHNFFEKWVRCLQSSIMFWYRYGNKVINQSISIVPSVHSNYKTAYIRRVPVTDVAPEMTAHVFCHCKNIYIFINDYLHLVMMKFIW